MVYYLRPSSSVSQSHSFKPRYSMSPRGYSMDSQSPVQQDGVKDDSLQHLTAYLVITVLVAAVTAVVIKFAIKPDANCVSYLTDKDENGNVTGLSPLKVTGASLATGLVVAGLTAAAHKLSLL